MARRSTPVERICFFSGFRRTKPDEEQDVRKTIAKQVYGTRWEGTIVVFADKYGETYVSEQLPQDANGVGKRLKRRQRGKTKPAARAACRL